MIKTSIEWINDLLAKNLSKTEIIKAIENAGIEIEDIEEIGNFDKNFLVGEIENVAEHPNADRLKLTKVRVGKEVRQIVCGADNIQAGDKVPVALPGAKLPDGTEIGQTRIRKITSEGMLCSAKELNIRQDHAGILILDEHLESGILLDEVIDETTVLDLRTAANRADLQSVWGITREVAAQKDVKIEDFNVKPLETSADSLFAVEATEKVLAYSAVLLQVKSPTLAESPRWMQQRLIVAGIQPKGLLIDATNYVMLETGQPLHVFDSGRITGNIAVREATKGESITTIDGSQLKLNPQDLVIADTDKPIALAGVIGGSESEVGPQTNEVLLESATFDGSSVRLTALRHRIRTEASARFERGLKASFMDSGTRRLLKILKEHAEIEIIETQRYERKSERQQSSEITVKTNDYKRVIGTEISKKEMEQFLQRLQCKFTKQEDKFIVQPPWWRDDLTIKEDLVEEFMKLKGLTGVSSELPHWSPDIETERNIHNYEFEKTLRALCIGAGLHEVVTYSFIGDEADDLLTTEKSHLPKLLNPRSAEQKYLRGSLLPNLLNTVSTNRKIKSEYIFFEISNVFREEKQKVIEVRKLGVLSKGQDSSYDCKGVVDMIAQHFNIEADIEMTNVAEVFEPNAQGYVLVADRQAGFIGKIRKDLILEHKLDDGVTYLEIELDILQSEAQEVRFQPLKKYQPSYRDITILINDEVLWRDVKATAISVEGVDASFVEEYRDENKYGKEQKAITMHLELSHDKKTLTEDEIDKKVNVIGKKIQKKYQGKII